MKKLFSVVLAFLMLMGCMSITSFADNNSATVYVSIATKGQLVAAQTKVTVTDIDGDNALTVNDALYAALRGAKENLGANWVKNGELVTANKATLVKLCQDISMATGSEVTIFGARSALSSLTGMADVNWAPESVKQEYYSNGGVLGNWEGFSLAEIGQGLKRGAGINSASVEYQLDTDRLYIIPTSVANKFIKLVNYGETQVSQVADKDVNRDMSYEYEVLYKMGINVILNTSDKVIQVCIGITSGGCLIAQACLQCIDSTVTQRLND